jgi:hypothetical protein
MAAERLLDIYLTDHLAGATAGLDLAKRLRDAENGHDALAAIAQEIEEDRDTLRTVMEAVEVSPSTLKTALGWAAEKAGRLKLNDRIFGRSPLSKVDELEGLIAGVSGKLELWRALTVIAPRDPRLSGFDFERLATRAQSQRERLERAHIAAVSQALASAAP